MLLKTLNKKLNLIFLIVFFRLELTKTKKINRLDNKKIKIH
jgi:hypothetical protein